MESNKIVNDIVWVVGQITEGGVSSDEWELSGIYTDESLAIDACRSDDYFIGPVSLNKPFPYERTIWYGSYYPKHEMSKEDQIKSYTNTNGENNNEN